MKKIKKITIGIPAYNRSKELVELLNSIFNCITFPMEVLICEDNSPEKKVIKSIVRSFINNKSSNHNVRYIENEVNLGYDANIRKIIELCDTEWLMLIGNDDLLLHNTMLEAIKFIENNPYVCMISRSFVRFNNDINKPLGISSILKNDSVINYKTHSPRYFFRSCGFVGGLIINVNWAKKLSTDKYDGSLYYQIYLAAHAYCQNGIGYISTPIVGGRADNPPMFGNASAESNLHTSGRYSPKSRAHMWASVIKIAIDIGKTYKINLVDDILHELRTRMSFHVFEMMVGRSKTEIDELCHELKKIGLYPHIVSIVLKNIVIVFGRYSIYFFKFVRFIYQR